MCVCVLNDPFTNTSCLTHPIPGTPRASHHHQTRLWPQLGVSPVLHNTCFAWSHFLQYAATRAMPLLVRCRALLKRLAALSAAQQQRGQHSTQQQQRQGTLLAAGLDSNDGCASLPATFLNLYLVSGLGLMHHFLPSEGFRAQASLPHHLAIPVPSPSSDCTCCAATCMLCRPPCLSHQAAQLDPSQFECDSHKQDDARLVAAVGAAVASWVNERLCDYHAR